MPNLAESVITGEELAQALEHAPADSRLPSGLFCGQSAMTQAVGEVDTAKMSATFTIVTTERNRHGNSHQITSTKLGKGLRTDQGFDANPVVLFDHGLSGNPFPVAKSSKVSRNSKAATATAVFPERLRDIYPNNLQNADDLLRGSAAVFAGVAEGLIRMASIGFAPILGMLRAEDGEGEQLAAGVERMDAWRGIHFTETELREWSIVTIGADRGSLKQTLERGKIHDVRLPEFFRQTLQRQVDQGEPDPVVVPVSVDVAALGQKVDRLARQVRRLAKLQTSQLEFYRAIGDHQSRNPVASDPQNQTIAPVKPKPDGEALAKQFLAATEPKRVDQSVLAQALTQAVDAAVKPLAASVEQIEQSFRQSLGRVD